MRLPPWLFPWKEDEESWTRVVWGSISLKCDNPAYFDNTVCIWQRRWVWGLALSDQSTSCRTLTLCWVLCLELLRARNSKIQQIFVTNHKSRKYGKIWNLLVKERRRFRCNTGLAQGWIQSGRDSKIISKVTIYSSSSGLQTRFARNRMQSELGPGIRVRLMVTSED
jgi:hypothetical protein